MLHITARWLYRTVLYSLAIMLVLFALLLTGLRYLLPQLPDVTENLEEFLANNYQITTQIGQLSADWSTSGPELILHQVLIKPSESQATQIYVDEARVHFNFWNTARTASAQFEQVSLNGMRVLYDLRDSRSDGDASVKLSNQLLQFFLTQLDHVEIQDSAVELVNLIGVKRTIDLHRLSWINQGAHHQGVGELKFAGVSDHTLDIIIDVQGNEPTALSGQVYVAANQVDITPWLQQQVVDTEVQQAEFNYTLWVNFEQNTFTRGTLELGENVLAWQVGQERHQLRVPEGKLQLQPYGEGWLVNSSPIRVEHNDTSWMLPVFSWEQTAASTAVSVDELPISPLLQLLSIFGSQGIEVRQQLADRQVTGNIDLAFAQRIGEQPQWHIQGTNLAWQEQSGVPGVQGAALLLRGSGQSMDWQLGGENLELTSNSLSSIRNWVVPRLALAGQLSWSDDTWQLSIGKESYIGLDGMQLSVQGNLYPVGDSLMIAAQAVSLDEAPITADALRRYLPEVMGSNLHDYLTVAIQTAEVDELAMVWRGRLDQFPYHHHEGVFHARARMHGLTYKFQPGWRPIYEADAVVDFHNERMHIVALDGLLADMALPRVDTLIPNLVDPEGVLSITADIKGDSRELLPVFSDSPLADSLGSTFEQLQLSGEITGFLELNIPLHNTSEVVASGYAELNNNQLYVASIQQPFTDLNGRITYNNATIASSNLTMNWFELPVELTLDGGSRSDDYAVQVTATGNWQLDKFKPLIAGGTDWQADFSLSLPHQGGYSFRWDQTTDLTETAINIPQPLTKATGMKGQLLLQVSGSQDDILINAQLDDDALLELQLSGDGDQLQNGYLRLGPTFGAAPNPNVVRFNPVFAVDLNLPETNIADWRMALKRLHAMLPSDTGESKVASLLTPDLIQLVAPQVTFLNHQLDNVALVAWPEDDIWQARLNSNQALADLSFLSNEVGMQLDINAEYIELAPPSDDFVAAETLASDNFNDVPNLNLVCKRCRYGKYELGQVQLQLESNDRELRLAEFSSQHSNHDIQLTGSWNLATAEQPEQTLLTGRLQSPDFGQFLSDYDLTSMVRDSTADIGFTLGWQGAPYHYNSETLNGDVAWRLGQGYLNEVSDRGARLLSLLSLDSILRKLRFDFRDVFANGLFYTSFGGDFAIENGVVHTDNTKLNGGAGDMEVKGNSNLVTGALDYRLQFVPKVTSSLPVILAWMINPPSGLAALLLDRVLHDAKVISSLEYKISGTIDEPIIEEVARTSRDAPIPQEVMDEQQPPSATDSNTNDQPAESTGQSGDANKAAAATPRAPAAAGGAT